MDKWFPIRTDRLLLREFSAADEADVHEYGSDLLVTRYTDWGPNTPDQTRGILTSRLEDQRKWPRDDVMLAAELLTERKVIGTIRLTILDRQCGIADCGFVFNRRGSSFDSAQGRLAQRDTWDFAARRRPDR
jgi:[ribosomal protein S5]-alanine N-acetyltransferase